VSRIQRLIDQAMKDLRHQNWRKRRRAMAALAGFGEKAIPVLIGALDDASLTVRLTAGEALEMVGPPAAPALIETLQNGSGLARRHAAAALGQLRDSRAAGPLIGGLQNGDTELRRACALALGSLRAAEAIPDLVAALTDDDPTVRGHCAEALGRIGSEAGEGEAMRAAVPALRARLGDMANYLSSQRRVCDAAADALRRIGTVEARRAVDEWTSG
jgi:HEAT repeat protein